MESLPHSGQRVPSTERQLEQVSPRFAELLRQFRRAAGLTQEQLAERAGLSAQAISALERGVRRTPYRNTIEALAVALALATEERAALVAASADLGDGSTVHQWPTLYLLPAEQSSAGNLPISPTPLLGRDDDLDAIDPLLRDPTRRLLTIFGPGGIGKTRLALAIAATLAPTYLDGAWFVPLAETTHPDQVIAAVANVLGLAEREPRWRKETLQEALRPKQVLLVLDNFEQVLAATPAIEDLLATCPQLRIIATSRATLRSRWERAYPLAPLALPEPHQADPATIAAAPAVALFLHRAASVRPAFALTDANAVSVAAICRRVEGIPLALELAASRLRLLTPTALLSRLENRFRALSSNGQEFPERQRSLWQTIDWSYSLLPLQQRALLRLLAIFADGCTVAAAEALAAQALDVPSEGDDLLDAIEALVTQSLLRANEFGDGELRLTMLEAIREFALTQVQREGELATLQAHHGAYFLTLLRGSNRRLRGPEQTHLLALLAREAGNLRAVLDWLVATGQGEAGLRACNELWRYWAAGGYHAEGCRWIDLFLGQIEAAALPPSEVQAAARCYQARLVYEQGEYQQARSLFEVAFQTAQQAAAIEFVSMAETQLGGIAIELGENDRARHLIEAGLSRRRRVGDQRDIAISLQFLGKVALSQSDYAAASQALGEAFTIAQALADHMLIGDITRARGEHALASGDAAAAAAHFSDAGALFRAANDQYDLLWALADLAHAQLAAGEQGAATTPCREALALARDIGGGRQLPHLFEAVSAIIRADGRPPIADHLRAVAAALREANGARVPHHWREHYHRIHAGAAPPPRAVLDLEAAYRLAEEELAADRSLPPRHNSQDRRDGQPTT